MKMDNVAYKLVDESVILGNVTIEFSPARVRANDDVRQLDVRAESRDRKADARLLSISPVWRDVAGRIDLRHASPLEMIDLSRTLYESGVISFEDHINLSFQPEVNADGDGAATEKKDFIALWQGKQDEALRQGAGRAELEDLHRIQAILGYIDSIR